MAEALDLIMFAVACLFLMAIKNRQATANMMRSSASAMRCLSLGFYQCAEVFQNA